MDRLTLLEQAKSAGLSVTTDGNLLVIRGPRWAECLAREMLRRKPEVLAELQGRYHPQLTVPELLAWASQLSESGLQLNEPIKYVEVPSSSVITSQPSSAATRYLKAIVAARSSEYRSPRDGDCLNPEACRRRKVEALGALASLRQAMLLNTSPGTESHD